MADAQAADSIGLGPQQPPPAVVRMDLGEKDPNLTKLRFLSVVDKVVLFSSLQPPRKGCLHFIR